MKTTTVVGVLYEAYDLASDARIQGGYERPAEAVDDEDACVIIAAELAEYREYQGRPFGVRVEAATPVRSLSSQVTEELERLGAGGPEGIEARPGDGGLLDAVELYDTQERMKLSGQRVLELLRALPDGAGFGATWEALAEL